MVRQQRAVPRSGYREPVRSPKHRQGRPGDDVNDEGCGVRVEPEPEPSEVADPLADDPRLPELFADAWPQIERFHDLLAEEGPLRGLIGPRETARLWERHMLNSAAVAAHLGGVPSLVDLGSGAGGR